MGSFGEYLLGLQFPIDWCRAHYLAIGTLWTLQSSQPGLSLFSALPQAYGTAYLAISLSVNIILTILIAIRLLLYRRTIMASMPDDRGSDYTSLATIIIESASLYSVFALIFLITYAVNNPINSVFLTVASSSQVSSPDPSIPGVSHFNLTANCKLPDYLSRLSRSCMVTKYIGSTNQYPHSIPGSPTGRYSGYHHDGRRRCSASRFQ